MTLREKVRQSILNECLAGVDFTERRPTITGYEQTVILKKGYGVDQAADAILAAIREHMTTEGALDRAAAAYWSDGDLVADIGDVLKKAILAALEDK